MNLKNLKDRELLSMTKQLVQSERKLLTQILHHLREVERRKLFCDLGCQSLFEYAVKELKYSEGQAGRRIQAMRLIKELPEIEKKIASGKLSLSNVSQAQSFFREAKKAEPQKRIGAADKLQVLASLENKSAREGQRVLLKIQPEVALPKERERILTESHTEMRFVMNDDLKKSLEELRSLMGPKGATMSLAELISFMTRVSIGDLRGKKFGKKRALTPAALGLNRALTPITPTLELSTSKNSRSVSRAVRHLVWTRDQGKCCKCGGQRNLNVDHIKPVALGGASSSDNLRLLCFHCNQRQAIKVFGIDHICRRKSAEVVRQLGSEAIR